MPGGSRTVPPAAEGTRATQTEAAAQTFASDSDAIRPASTAVGVTRESSTGAPPARARSVSTVVVVALVVIAAFAGTSFVLLRGHKSVATKVGAEPTAAAPPAPTVLLPPPSANAVATQEVVLAPESSALPYPFAAPSTHQTATPPGAPKPLPRGTANAANAASAAPLPTELGDLKLH